MTPKKRKQRYLEVDEVLVMDPAVEVLESPNSWKSEHPDAIKILAMAIQNLEGHFTNFQLVTGEDVDGIISKIQEERAAIGAQACDFAL
jgi:serine/threonine-protein kinase RIO1